MQIYKITNLITGKIYIGKDEADRPGYYGSGKLIGRSLKKYGKVNHTKEVLEEVSDRILLGEREKYWIEHYNATARTIGYNISKGGDGGDTFTNNPKKEEVRKKISEAMKNRVFTEEHKANLRKNHNSKQEEVRQKISMSKKGKTKTQEHKAKIAETVRKHNLETGKWQGENNPMVKYTYKWYHNPETLKTSRHRIDQPTPSDLLPGRPKNWENQHKGK
jgi:hypothetical protein